MTILPVDTELSIRSIFMSTIPVYNLPSPQEFEVFRMNRYSPDNHCPPHRHSFYEISFFIKGQGSHSIDFIEYPIVINRVYFTTPGQLHSWEKMKVKNQYDGYIVRFNENFLNSDQLGNIKRVFDQFDTQPFIQLATSPPEIQLLEMIYTEFNQEKNFSVLRPLVNALLAFLAQKKSKTESKIQNVNQERIVKLQNLVEKNYRFESDASFYATKLEITPKRLNEILKQVIGKTITQLVHDRLLLEAKRELVYGNLSIKDIGYILGFEDPSYFSRFFKKYTGIEASKFKELQT